MTFNSLVFSIFYPHYRIFFDLIAVSSSFVECMHSSSFRPIEVNIAGKSDSDADKMVINARDNDEEDVPQHDVYESTARRGNSVASCI